MKTTEHKLQCAVARYLDHAIPYGTAIWFSVPNGGQRSKATAGKLRAEGVKAGVADLIVIAPHGVLAIELKTDTGRQSQSQRGWQSALEDVGHTYRICRSIDEVEEALREFGLHLHATVWRAA